MRLLAAFLFLSGCGAQTLYAPNQTLSTLALEGVCNFSSAGASVCVDYSGPASNADVQAACSAASGAFTAASQCSPNADAGTCAVEKLSPSDQAEQVTYHYHSPATVTDVQQACAAMKGTFAAGTDAACTNDDGTVVMSGLSEQRTRYQTSQAPCASENQTRSCDNGTWTAWSGTFDAPTCNPVP